MKTTIIDANKNTIKALRRQLAQAQRDAMEQEQGLILDALHITEGKPMTARQISQALSGQLSSHQIAGNFRFAGTGTRYGKTSRYPKLWNPDGKVVVRSQRVSRRFIECDENGQPVSDRMVIFHEEKNTYEFKPDRQ